MPRSARARPAVLLALALAAGPAQAQAARDGGAGEGPDGGPAPYRAFAGKVTGIDWAAQRLTVERAGRPVDMTFDRNTQVYLPERLGTLFDLGTGVEVRAAQGPTGLAIWVEVLLAAGPAPGAPRDGGLPADADGGAGGRAAPSPPSGSRP